MHRIPVSDIQAMRSGDTSFIISGSAETLESHLVVFAAERARLENRVVALREMYPPEHISLCPPEVLSAVKAAQLAEAAKAAKSAAVQAATMPIPTHVSPRLGKAPFRFRFSPLSRYGSRMCLLLTPP